MASEPVVVGLRPWVPWPLSAWRWWTEPVRAERLAALRIGLAAVLLFDVLTSYWPHRAIFFGPGSLGDPAIFGYRGDSPRWYWSILWGVRHPLVGSLALAAWALTGGHLVLAFLARRRTTPAPTPLTLRWALQAFLISGAVLVISTWARLPPDDASTAPVVIGLALVHAGLAVALLLLGAPGSGLRAGGAVFAGAPSLTGWLRANAVVAGVLAAWALWQVLVPGEEAWGWLRLSWGEAPDVAPTFITAAMLVWIVATVTLLLGLWSRLSALIVWIVSTSFGNVNPYIDNNGDVARALMVFYLMLCPCGAVWSLDRWIARKRGQQPASAQAKPTSPEHPRQPVYVHPWALRLLFLQLVLIYFVNGLYKLSGEDWRSGHSLHYVLGSISLTRVSPEQLPLPGDLLRLMSWTVLVWEVGFPLLVALPWTRLPTLLMGVAFHLGILATLVLGPFQFYMLVLYLPLVPWERWFGPPVTSG